MRRFLVALGSLVVALATSAPAAQGTPEVDPTPTSLAIGSVTNVGAELDVLGTLTLGSDALAAVQVGTDASGDASPGGAGLDIGNITITPDFAKNVLVVSMGLNDATATGGTPPAAGVRVPVVVAGEDHTWWLAAGNAGSNQTKTGKWTGLCTNETSTGGWDCSKSLSGSQDATHVVWNLGFSKVTPAIEPGLTVDITGGPFSGIPESFFWPSSIITAGLVSADVEDSVSQYLVPGGIQVGVARAGTALSAVKFTGTGTFSPSDGSFTGSVATPTSAGAYDLWVRSCYGLGDTPACVTASVPVTI